MSHVRVTRGMLTATVMLTVLPLSTAQADTYRFRDVLRPSGQARSMAAKYADGRSCGASADHVFGDVAALQTCMRFRGWVVDRYTPDATQTRVDARRRAVAGSSRYIDPDTGMSCQNYGGIAVCDPPRGTVRYYDSKHGLNCTRTGLVAICSNF